MTRRRTTGATVVDRGAALVFALLVTVGLAALGLGLATVFDTEVMVSANHRAGLASFYAADAMAERAIADLIAAPPWSDVLAGGAPSPFVDATTLPALASGDTLDLVAITASMQAASDDAAQLAANNPVWRLYAYGPLAALVGGPGGEGYVAAWIADDLADDDGDPLADSNDTIVLRVEAFGPGRARRRLAVTLERTEEPDTGSIRVRVLSWKRSR